MRTQGSGNQLVFSEDRAKPGQELKPVSSPGGLTAPPFLVQGKCTWTHTLTGPGNKGRLILGPGDENHGDRTNGTGLWWGQCLRPSQGNQELATPAPPRDEAQNAPSILTLCSYTHSLILGLLCFQEQSPPDPLESPEGPNKPFNSASYKVSLTQIPHPTASWHTPALVNIWQMNL